MNITLTTIGLSGMVICLWILARRNAIIAARRQPPAGGAE